MNNNKNTIIKLCIKNLKGIVSWDFLTLVFFHQTASPSHRFTSQNIFANSSKSSVTYWQIHSWVMPERYHWHHWDKLSYVNDTDKSNLISVNDTAKSKLSMVNYTAKSKLSNVNDAVQSIFWVFQDTKTNKDMNRNMNVNTDRDKIITWTGVRTWTQTWT